MKLTLLIVSVISLSVVFANADEGVTDNERNVEIRPFEENGSLTGASATRVVNAPVDIVWGIITDHNHSEQFMPTIKKCREIRRDKNHVWTETVTSAGLLTSTVIAHTTEFREKGLILFEQESGPFSKCEGFWLVKDNGNGSSLLTYQVRLELELIPDWLKNVLLHHSLPGLFTGIRNRARELR